VSLKLISTLKKNSSIKKQFAKSPTQAPTTSRANTLLIAVLSLLNVLLFVTVNVQALTALAEA
jgi:hypothetical protein